MKTMTRFPVVSQKSRAKLAAVAAKIPDNPALPNLIRALTTASKSTGVELVTLTPGTPTAAAVPAAAPGAAPVAAPVTTTGVKFRLINLATDKTDSQLSMTVNGVVRAVDPVPCQRSPRSVQIAISCRPHWSSRSACPR